MPARTYEFDRFRLDAAGGVLFRNAERVALTPKAVELLTLLVEAGGKPVGKDELLAKVWADTAVEEGSLTSHISTLRKALGEAGDSQTFIETIPKRGYRFVAPVRIVENGSHVPQAPPSPGGSVKSARGLRFAGLIAAALFLLALIGYFPPRRLFTHDHSAQGRLMIAVLPFENLTGDPAQEFVSDGLTEEMITRMGSLNYERLGVIARTSVMTYKASTKPVDQIGRELGVNYILEGSVRSWGHRVRISAQLVQVSDQTHIWAESYERDAGDVLALQSDVAQAIAREIDVKIAPQSRERLENPQPTNPEAYDAYLKGRYFWYKRTAEALNKSIGYFQEAIASEPSYAQAYVGLADAYLQLAGRGYMPAKEALPKAKAAARKALEIDDNLGEAHASYAHIRLHDWDWQGLDDEFKRAIELNPANAFSYYYYSEYLMPMGRADESIALDKKVEQIDPVSVVLHTTLPTQYYFIHRYPESIDLLNKAVELDPNHFLPHFRLGQVYIQLGQSQQAIAEMQKAVGLSGRSTETLAGLGQAYAAAGMKQPLQAILNELDQRSHESYISAYYMAKIYASSGDKERALAWLEKAYQEHNMDLIELKAEPTFDALHSDSRFAQLLSHIGFQQI